MEGCSLLNSSSSYSPVSSSWGKITITMSLFLAWPRGIQVYQTHIIPCLAKRHSSQPNTHYSLHGQEAFKSTKHTFLAWPRGIQVNQTHIIPCMAKRHSSLPSTHYSLPGQEAFKSTKHTLFLAWWRGVQVYQTHITITCMAKRCSSLSNTCHHHLPGQEVFKSVKHSCQMRLGHWWIPNCSTQNSLKAVTLLALWSTLLKLI